MKKLSKVVIPKGNRFCQCQERTQKFTKFTKYVSSDQFFLYKPPLEQCTNEKVVKSCHPLHILITKSNRFCQCQGRTQKFSKFTKYVSSDHGGSADVFSEFGKFLCPSLTMAKTLTFNFPLRKCPKTSNGLLSRHQELHR
jgi:hypothetical protein